MTTEMIDIGKPYKKIGKLPLFADGEPIPNGTLARTTDGVYYVKNDADSWRRLDSPETPYISMLVLI